MRERSVRFGPFRLDAEGGQLWRHDEPVTLRRKTWAVLCLLIEKAGQLVSKDDLLDLVWKGIRVTDNLPGVSIAELRRALNDDVRSPRYIQTVYGRGFRFIGTIEDGPFAEPVLLERSALGAIPVTTETTGCFVGRRTELSALRAFVHDEEARARIMLIAGEAGIGKTGLADVLVSDLERPSAGATPDLIAIGRGQCPPHFGETCSFLPVLGVLAELCRTSPHVPPLLEKTAPSWLARLPGRGNAEVPSDLSMDELVEFLRALGRAVLAFEDLHWADHATLDAIGVIAEHPSLAGCRVLGTYRPGDAAASAHPILRTKREWLRRGRAKEMVLDGLAEADVRAYLLARFPGSQSPGWLATDLLSRTNGNPLFLTVTVDYLLAAGALQPADRGLVVAERFEQIANEIPETLRDFVRQRFVDLDQKQQRRLGAASVVGLEADAAATAAALGEPVAEVDRGCDDLARSTLFVRRTGESIWPDGRVSGRYAFRHPLYQRVLYDEVPPAVRCEQHRRVANSLMHAYGERRAEIASVVADHYERGRAMDEAVDCHVLAADAAAARHASADAVAHLRRAFELQRDSDDAQREATILARLAIALPPLHGFGGHGVGPEFSEQYARARSLRTSHAELTQGCEVLIGLGLSALMQGNAKAAEEWARELREISAAREDAQTRYSAEILTCAVLYYQGDLVGSLGHLASGFAAASPAVALGPVDPRTGFHTMGACMLWQSGRPKEALECLKTAIDVAESGAHPFNLILARQSEAAIHHWCGNVDLCRQACEQLRVLAGEQGIGEVVALTHLLEAWCYSTRDDAAATLQRTESALEILRRDGAMMNHVYLLATAAELYVHLDHTAQAAIVLDEAETLIERGGARFWEPEVHRWRGEVFSRLGDATRAEGSFREAIRIAEQQGSGSLTLRSAIGLATLDKARGRGDDRRRILAEALSLIVDGEATQDVRRARDLLQAL